MKLRLISESTIYKHYYRGDGAGINDTIKLIIPELKNGSYPGRYFTTGDPKTAALYYGGFKNPSNIIEADIQYGLIVDGWDSIWEEAENTGTEPNQEVLLRIASKMHDVPQRLIDQLAKCLNDPDRSSSTLHTKMPTSAITIMQEIYQYYKKSNWHKKDQVVLPDRKLHPDEVVGIHLCKAYDVREHKTRFSPRIDESRIIITKTLYDNGSELVVGQHI